MTTAIRRVKARSEFCMGCGLCRLACQVAHSAYPLNIVKAMKTGEKPVARMSVETSADGMDFRTVRCLHCEDPECIKTCISGAISRDEASGVVTINEQKCVGCWSCVIACPEGSIIGPGMGRSKAYKCDLCLSREVPACVAACPNAALLLVKEPAAGVVKSTNGEG